MVKPCKIGKVHVNRMGIMIPVPQMIPLYTRNGDALAKIKAKEKSENKKKSSKKES